VPPSVTASWCRSGAISVKTSQIGKPEKVYMLTRVACSLLIIISAGLLIGCQSVSPSQNSNSHNRSTQKSEELDDAEILKLVVTFSGDEDEESAEAWKKLSSYPPQQITGKLVQISRSLPEDDHHRVLIAFVLCNLK
jgi:hypothetical protein